ncbi:ABC transporter permease [Candidatus Acetothermia bacterium]|nr:MAG: ABC transporter permease [Candidatus Acetothermia bacterium]HDN19572.1 ABC transporter permease [Candidatus Acetothermia bacterium]
MRAPRSALIILFLTLLFLLGPFVILFWSSFGTQASLAFPPEGFTVYWFKKVLGMRMFVDAFRVSVLLALSSTAAALLLGIPAAYALVRFSFPGRSFLELLFTSPIIVPGLVLGFALLRFFTAAARYPVSLRLFLGHMVLLFPYTVRVISASLRNFDPTVEEAAVSLGAPRWLAFLRVVLPNLRAGVMAAFILAFITSFNNVPVSLFLSGPGVTTLPIQMLTYMEYYYDPTIAALSTLLILFTVVTIQLVEKTLGLSTTLGG